MFPLSFREAGGVLYQTSPTLLHLNHPVVWNIENNLSGALKAKDVFAGKFGLSSSELNDEESIDAYAEQFFNCVRNSATYVSLRGTSLSARMIDQLTVELRCNIDTTYDREQVVSRAIEAYRRSRPSSKIAGECLCTVSQALRKVGLATNFANWLFQLGDDLQFGARKNASKMRRSAAMLIWSNALSASVFESETLCFILGADRPLDLPGPHISLSGGVVG